MNVVPHPKSGLYKTGELRAGLKPAQISKILGFKPNCRDDEDKVKHSWGCLIDGVHCGIWDYKGFRWSIYDPEGKLAELFKFH